MVRKHAGVYATHPAERAGGGQLSCCRSDQAIDACKRHTHILHVLMDALVSRAVVNTLTWHPAKLLLGGFTWTALCMICTPYAT